MDYYKILSLNKTATPNQIKQSYRKLILIWHPDKNKNVETTEFMSITEAYNVLSDLSKRKIYDEFGLNLEEIDKKEKADNAKNEAQERAKEAKKERERKKAEKEKIKQEEFLKKLEDERIKKELDEKARLKKLEDERIKKELEEKARLKKLEEERINKELEEKARKRQIREEEIRKQREKEIEEENIKREAKLIEEMLQKTKHAYYLKQSHKNISTVLHNIVVTPDLNNLIKEDVLNNLYFFIINSDVNSLQNVYNELRKLNGYDQTIKLLESQKLNTSHILELANNKYSFDSVKTIIYEYVKLITHIKPEVL